MSGATILAALAGCATNPFESAEPPSEYSLTVESIDASPVEYALYEPDDGVLFGTPARNALDDILPDGRHTSYGYKPLPSDAYVTHDESYYETEHVVTGRTQMKRQLVRVDPLPKEEVPDDAVVIDTLDQPSSRPLKILHSYTQSNGETSNTELLHGDAYVLRRPAERGSRLATGDLAGRVVKMTDSGTWAYRVRVTREPVVETAYTALAIKVADSRSQFRDVVFGSRIDTELTPTDLPTAARDLLNKVIAQEPYTETAPLSDAYETVLEALGLGAVDTIVNGQLLWYDDAVYRYGLYVNPPSS
ncbi:hypothetical protein [Halobacterium sp. CBA1126]|uniref:hypothetical protein n=1 Tax=Halobacterium TaxID=2239 RepID=UPI0018D2253E|nr:hypothetical protein [Halobacterium sp. CBA1126]